MMKGQRRQPGQSNHTPQTLVAPSQKPPLIFPIQPFSLENFVGLGIFLGFLYHGFANWDKIFGSDNSDMINFSLMTIFIASFCLNVGNLLYQLIFWVFRCYNRRLIQQHDYQVLLERIMQLIFGLCVGGCLLYNWKTLTDNSVCISKSYCPDSDYMKRTLEMRNEVCDKGGAFCKEFFYRFPALFLTFRAVAAALFVQLFWEWKSRLQISMTVFKSA